MQRYYFWVWTMQGKPLSFMSWKKVVLLLTTPPFTLVCWMHIFLYPFGLFLRIFFSSVKTSMNLLLEKLDSRPLIWEVMRQVSIFGKHISFHSIESSYFSYVSFFLCCFLSKKTLAGLFCFWSGWCSISSGCLRSREISWGKAWVGCKYSISSLCIISSSSELNLSCYSFVLMYAIYIFLPLNLASVDVRRARECSFFGVGQQNWCSSSRFRRGIKISVRLTWNLWQGGNAFLSPIITFTLLLSSFLLMFIDSLSNILISDGNLLVLFIFIYLLLLWSIIIIIIVIIFLCSLDELTLQQMCVLLSSICARW